MQAFINYSLNQEHIDKVIIGINSCKNLSQITKSINLNKDLTFLKSFAIDDNTILDPFRWKL